MKNNNKHPYIVHLKSAMAVGKIDRREFLRQSVLVGMSVTSAYALSGLTMSDNASAETPKYGGNLRVSMPVQEITDPATNEWPIAANIQRHVIEGLVVIGTDGVTRPLLLEKWQASNDLKTWTLHLRKNVKWSNGDMFTEDDVVFNINRWLDPKVGSSMQGRLLNLTEEIETGETNEDGSPKKSRVASKGAVTKVDDYTVRLQLNRADISLPESLADYPALIVHKDFSGKWTDNPVGTGAFSLAKYEVGVTAVLKRRSDGQYWGDKPYLEQITYIDLGDDGAAELSAFASDQIDYAHETSADQVDVVKSLPNINLLQTVTAATAVARMNITQKPFDDIRVRKAFVLAVDNEAVLKIGYQGRGVEAENHHVSPAHPAYSELPKLTRDIAKANALLKEAGYPEGIDVNIDVRARPAWESNVCLAIADQAREAGIRIKVNIMPGSNYFRIWQTTPFGLTPWNHRPLATQILNLAYRSGASWNESGYANPEFDKLLDKAGATLDVDERRNYMAKLEKILQDDAIMVQPFWRLNFSAVNKRVKNINMHVSLEHHFNKVWLS